MLALLLTTLSAQQVDMSMSPESLCVTPGSPFEIELTLSGDAPAQVVVGLDLILTWDPAAMTLLSGDTTPVDGAWLATGFLPDASGLNDSLFDGDALLTQLASPSLPPSVPPDLTTARLRFLALDDGVIQFPATLGAAQSRIIGLTPGVPLTGALPDPVDVGVAPPTAAAEVVRVGSPPNPAAFLPGQTSGPVLGQVWDPVVDHTTFLPGAVLDFFAVSLVPVDVALPDLGTLLCLPPIVAGPFSTTPGTPFAVPIPELCALVGAGVCTQAFSVDGLGQVRLTNALDVIFGTF